MNKLQDVQIQAILEQEKNRQKNGINLIASENYALPQVMDVSGSVFTNKYVEGYPGRRYYSGCKEYDQLEQLAIDRFKSLFGADHANVQPHSGSQANAAVYVGLLQPGDTILSMDLAAGGHLSHGHKVNWTHQIYKIINYGVDKKSYLLDYDQIEQLALQHKPKLIIAGASAYSRAIDFQRFGQIAKKVNALLMADIAHLAGFVVAGLHQSPVPFADVVTFTTHKTFPGPHGAVILCKQQYAHAIDKMVMPGTQGGALMNHVAGKAVVALYAQSKEFIVYHKQVIANAQRMAQEFVNRGYTVITGGTDTHLFLIDLANTGLDGSKVEQLLEQADIFVNRNMIPFDTKAALFPGGIRIGTLAITSLGAQEIDAVKIAVLIDTLIKNHDDTRIIAQVQKHVHLLTKQLRLRLKSL